MVRKLMPIFLLCLTYFVGEAHTFWQNDTTVQNWILFAYKPMTVQWNVKYLSEEIINVMVVVAFSMMLKNGWNKYYGVTATIYLTYRLLDVVFYFATFKTYNYYWIFLIISLFEVYLWYKNGITDGKE